MKPATIIVLQVLLVGAAILVYDVMRHEPGAGVAPAELAQPPTAGMDDETAHALRERLGGLVARVEALERRAHVRLEAPASAPPVAPSGPERPYPAAPPVVPFSGEFDAEELARFRALLELARRQQEAEALRTSLARRLDDLPLSLSEDQRSAVLEEALRAYDQSRAARADLNARNATHERRREVIAGLRDEFRQGVGRVVAGSHGAVVTDALATSIGLATIFV